MTLREELLAMGERAAVAAQQLALLNTRKKNAILAAMADAICESTQKIISANADDLETARRSGLSSAMLDRLMLNEARIAGMAQGLNEAAGLQDPVGRKLRSWTRPDGLRFIKVSVPIGVIAILYEARPNVTADAAGLCLKASNAVILRGGREALSSNIAIMNAMIAGGRSAGCPQDAIQLVQSTDREAVREIVQLEGLVGLVIPRGGEGLIRAVTQHARVPVIKHYKGVCHVYVDVAANQDMALDILENAKCQRPGVCNAVEKVLIHEKIAAQFLPRLVERLTPRSVELRGDEISRALVPSLKEATQEDWRAEYLDLILAVKIVPNAKAAAEHINRYGSHHSDAIVTESARNAGIFTKEVDSAAVYINASTRFTDGGEFGFGAEIGISTEKIHARGPMGLEELTSYKYVVKGKGHIRK